MGTLETTVLTAEDRLAIHQLLAEYSVYEDSGAAQEWAALFTSDGRFVSKAGKETVGREALAAFATERWKRPEVRRWVHWVNNVTIKPVPEGAEAFSYAMVVEKSEDGTFSIVNVQAKRDTLRVEDGAWRFHVRRVEVLQAS
ncbi:hypothetical protein RVR_8718 [Actinacidiphila reveromycinica]|uniref:SnoaL-like domain-containing protein n=1 Tax=Actinacidiphila reveromycinica TaxID=659352 RepID=A0A7U3UYS6_9ACTN|nr:nuclear transport factor 2 family protein [Streptomyces sp. SN-593]BBB01349.1 hypothetical protein RVR_8718 [Streptomyces sp. SN-593]